jgi:hypothetical protein
MSANWKAGTRKLYGVIRPYYLDSMSSKNVVSAIAHVNEVD